MPAENDHEWYVFVLLGEEPDERPRCFVVPRDHAVAGVWIRHQDWLTDPDMPEGRRHDREVRVPPSVFERYEEAWDLLDEPTDRVPVLLPPRYKAYFTSLGSPSRAGTLVGFGTV